MPENDQQYDTSFVKELPDGSKCYPVPPDNLDDEPLSKKVDIPIFHPDLNNMGVDELMTKSFLDILQLKVDSGEWKAALRDNGYSDFYELKKALKPAYLWGTTTAVAQFCFLRWAGARWMNRSLHKGFFWPWRVLVPKSGMLQDARRQRSPWQQRLVTRKDGTTKFKEGWITKPFTLMLDATVSVFSGLVVAFVKADKLKLYKAVEEIPLKEGQSPVSNLLCKDFLVQDEKIPEELWEDHTDPVMKSLRTFIDNCQRRTLYEQQIRRDKFLPPNEKVSIPKPGVPPDLELPAEDEYEEQEMTGKRATRIVAPKAWSPEDYTLWDDDSEDDWEVTNDD